MRAAARRADGAAARLDLGQRRGHGGGQQRGGAVAGVQARDALDGVAGLHGVGAAAAVHVQVDEAGQHDAGAAVAHAGRRHRFAVHAHDAAAVVLEHAAHEALRREDVALDAVGHVAFAFRGW